MNPDDMLNIREFAKRDDAFDILSRSIAPSIYGHNEIKQVRVKHYSSCCCSVCADSKLP